MPQISPIYWPLVFLILTHLIMGFNSVIADSSNFGPLPNQSFNTPTTNNKINW